jgi:carbon storage regulator CsrA
MSATTQGSETGNLIVARRIGEAIVIEGGIEVRVNDIRGHQVHLAIRAPKSIRVDRKEVWQQRVLAIPQKRAVPQCSTGQKVQDATYNCIDLKCEVHGARNRVMLTPAEDEGRLS